MDAKAHWETVYRTKRPNEVSWYRPHLDLSLQLIEEAAPQRDAQIIDVGGGEATLIDDLLASGYRGVSVLDLSATALDVAKARLLGPREYGQLALRRCDDIRICATSVRRMARPGRVSLPHRAG